MKKTIIDLFENSVKQYPDNPFLWEKTRDAFEPTTYKEVQQSSLRCRCRTDSSRSEEGRQYGAPFGRPVMLGSSANWPCSMPGATNVPLSIKLEEANDLLFRLVHADVKYILIFRQPAQKDTGYLE